MVQPARHTSFALGPPGAVALSRRSPLIRLTTTLLALCAAALVLSAAAPPVRAAGTRDWTTPALSWLITAKSNAGTSLLSSLGVARLDVPYVFESNGYALYATPCSFTPQSGASEKSGGLEVVRLSGVRLLGVTEVGVPKPDIWVFYVKDADSATVFWRQATEKYNTEHSFAWPGGNWSADFTFEADNAGRWKGDVGLHNGYFAFAWIDGSGNLQLCTNLDLARSSGPAVADAKRRQLVPATTDGQVRYVDLSTIYVGGAEYLCAASTFGTPLPPALNVDPAYGNWAMTEIDLNFVRWSRGAWRGEWSEAISLGEENSFFSPLFPNDRYYGARGVGVLQANVKGGDDGDVLQVFAQHAGRPGASWTFCDQAVSRVEYSLEQRQVVGRDFMYDLTVRDEDAPKFGVDRVGFHVFSAPDGSQGVANGGFVGFNEYVWVASTQVHQSGGQAVTRLDAFKSNALVPIASEVIGGETITYPVAVEAIGDPDDWSVVGIVYGPPPFSLQGYTYEEFAAALKKGSSTSFKSSTGDTSKLGSFIGGSVTGVAGNEQQGLSGSVTFGLDYSTASTTSFVSELSFLFKHTTTNAADYGYMICTRPYFTMQAFVRKTPQGKVIPGSRVYAYRPVATQGQTVTSYPVNMVDPDNSPISKGMRAHARSADFSNPLWQKDPLAGAGRSWSQISRVRISGDVRGGDSTSSVTQSSGEIWSLAGKLTLGLKYKSPAGGLSAEGHAGFNNEGTTSNSDNITVTLAVDKPKTGAESTTAKPLAQRIEVETYWMKANDSSAYWIPSFLRTGGNDQRPWCIDYRVVSWEAYPVAARSAGADSAAAGVCTVSGVASPAVGGRVQIESDGAEATAVAEVPVGGSARITAIAADGYSFAGWSTSGGQLAIGSASAAETVVSVSAAGGATVVAAFERVKPTEVAVTRRNSEACDLSIKGAPLPAVLKNVDTTSGPNLGVVIGDTVIDLPDEPTGGRQGHGGALRYMSRPWGPKSQVMLTLQLRRGTWCLKVTGCRSAGGLLHQFAAGEVTLAPTIDGQPVGCTTVPVAASSRFTQAAVGGGRMSRGKSRKVELRKAAVQVQVPANARQTRFILENAQVNRQLLDRRGFQIALNGQQIKVGPFQRRGDVWVWQGRSLYQYDVFCSYSAKGSMTIKLSGEFLRPQLPDLLGRNLTLRVVNGDRADESNMITAERSLRGVKPR